MKFDELDRQMRAFELVRDPCALPGLWIVARIDGRSFTRLTGEIMKYEKPFDRTFHDHMTAAVMHLMDCGFRVVYGYTQSDEISLLFDPAEDAFNRNVRKWTSILAGEASGAFSVRVGRPAAFDCRVIELPSNELVVDYFRWRNEDAHRNALNGWCYWKLREEGLDVRAATQRLEKLSTGDKNELLYQHGINFNELPLWQRRGSGVVWESFEKATEKGSAIRKRLKLIEDLPMRQDYGAFIQSFLRYYSGSFAS